MLNTKQTNQTYSNMKTLILTILMMATLGGQSFAAGSDKIKTEAKSNANAKTEILTAEQEQLFEKGILSEEVVKPVYTEAEQLIFTEQLKTLKEKN
jgi:hypothetical protein